MIGHQIAVNAGQLGDRFGFLLGDRLGDQRVPTRRFIPQSVEFIGGLASGLQIRVEFRDQLVASRLEFLIGKLAPGSSFEPEVEHRIVLGQFAEVLEPPVEDHRSDFIGAVGEEVRRKILFDGTFGDFGKVHAGLHSESTAHHLVLFASELPMFVAEGCELLLVLGTGIRVGYRADDG